ncbi:hypothetical protein HETIRDRAFT_119056 [Heterobasidion irregulare TC 32-1]|uniref:Uncharacterized protein n=1 Tax=Heterobasidion irregulare (strain TC 32-1) TaxID=747525 RepID=W4JQ33_HETIT|nr:uncharacterized protein HETIRDRAFT_119056 [Heterobasidion irregulare TC 32-1]ETW75643.1 hypothetical protein HETIRDRAFT_119056 [Heterobasidion irregulare TC 32-1]
MFTVYVAKSCFQKAHPYIHVQAPSLSYSVRSDSSEESLSPPPSAHRWSELVPPKTALTFAALYDPKEGLITFTGPSLLPSSPNETHRSSSPLIPSDGQSQVFTIDRMGTCTPALSTAQFSSDTAMADMRSMLDMYFRCGTPGGMRCKTPNTTLDGEVRASSAIDGLYVNEGAYSFKSTEREEAARKPHALRSKVRKAESLFAWSWLERLGETLVLNPLLDTRDLPPSDHSEYDSPFVDSGYVGEDDYFAEKHPFGSFPPFFDGEPEFYNPNERSAFSVTTTSTSNYIDVPFPDTPSRYSTATDSSWSTLEVPDSRSVTLLGLGNRPFSSSGRTGTPTIHIPETTCPSSPSPFHHRRRLQKPRSVSVLPAKPSEVLARPRYNHVSSPPTLEYGTSLCKLNSTGDKSTCCGKSDKPSYKPKHAFKRAVLNRLGSLRRDSSDAAERWVCIDVTQTVTQREIREDDC